MKTCREIEEFGRHQELSDSRKLAKYEKDYFPRILDGSATEVDLTSALENLSKMLTEHYGKTPVIIIDEYDTPIQEGYAKDFYDEIIGFMRNFFSALLMIIRIFPLVFLLVFYVLSRRVFSVE